MGEQEQEEQQEEQEQEEQEEQEQEEQEEPRTTSWLQDRMTALGESSSCRRRWMVDSHPAAPTG